MAFRQKLQLLLILLVGISCGLLLWMSLRKANRLAFELIQEKVYSIAVSTSPRIDGDKVEALTSPEQEDTPLYNELRDALREVRDANKAGALPVRFVYIIRPLENGDWEYVVDAEEKGENHSPFGSLVEFDHDHEKPDLKWSRADEQYAKDSFGVWLSAFSPILNSAGEPVAVVGVDIAASRIQTLLRKLLYGDLIAMSIALLLASALAAWLSRKVTRPLTELTEFAREIGKGNFATRMKVQGSDEFGELASAVNQMAEGLEERESLKGALVHYVRSQAADSKVSGSSGGEEPSPRQITALVAELCGFSQLSSQLGSERVFALLNEYFSTMIDVVLRHGGSLEKSNDESVIAIFGAQSENPHQERNSIESALAMQNALAKLLDDWHIQTNAPVFLEVGIHTGTAMIQHIGLQDQLDFDSVRRVVETAGTIAKVGRKHQNRLTISDTTAENLHHTFPLNSVDDHSLDYGLFSVSMPKAKSR
ncbi:MAG: adenylate/guanylate cyclase domain-containing protein [Verrucomicrobiales bacterium]|nr:adenylate/guanylate cyclase domain-containing protein [Verrucomicrobiales bacterium]